MKINKRIALIVFAVVVLAAVTGMTTLRGHNQESVQSESRREKEEPTLIREGQVTEKQRIHSKLFKHSGPKLRNLAVRQTGNIEVEEGVGHVIRLPGATQKLPVFQSALCNADAAVVGTINSKSSQLTDEGNFVFTDYEITVEEVVKNNATARMQSGTLITATRDGGVVELNNRVFSAKREDFDSPSIGKRYFLFLRFIPTTGSYLMYGNGTFQLEAQKVTALGPLAREELLSGGSRDTASFLSEIRAFSTTDCLR